MGVPVRAALQDGAAGVALEAPWCPCPRGPAGPALGQALARRTATTRGGPPPNGRGGSASRGARHYAAPLAPLAPRHATPPPAMRGTAHGITLNHSDPLAGSRTQTSGFTVFASGRVLRGIRCSGVGRSKSRPARVGRARQGVTQRAGQRQPEIFTGTSICLNISRRQSAESIREEQGVCVL